MKILLIDDDKDDGLLFRDALQEIDASTRFEHVINSREGLNKLLASNVDLPDLIFLDINMPIVSGWDCLIEFKKAVHLKEIPVYIYSTSSRLQEQKMAQTLGAAGFVTKPDDFKELKLLVARIIAKPYT